MLNHPRKGDKEILSKWRKKLKGPKERHPLPRDCRKCDKRFTPHSRGNWLCEDCYYTGINNRRKEGGYDTRH